MASPADSLKNCCPLSLLCTDYKIIAKVFADRSKSIIANITQEDQIGFIPQTKIHRYKHHYILGPARKTK
jgi:hypothetical protein